MTREETREEIRKPVRAPIVLASAAVAVPAAVQPTAPRGRDFKPAPVAFLKPVGKGAPVGMGAPAISAEPTRVAGLAPGKVAGLNPGLGRGAQALPPARPGAAPKALAGQREPHLRLASAQESTHASTPEPRKAAAGKPVPPAMPPSAKLAMARLAAQPAPAVKAAGKPGGRKPEPARVAGQGARYAGIY